MIPNPFRLRLINDMNDGLYRKLFKRFLRERNWKPMITEQDRRDWANWLDEQGVSCNYTGAEAEDNASVLGIPRRTGETAIKGGRDE